MSTCFFRLVAHLAAHTGQGLRPEWYMAVAVAIGLG